MMIEENPQIYFQNAIDNLPEEDHRKATELAAELAQVEDDIKNTDIRLKTIKNGYDNV